MQLCRVAQRRPQTVGEWTGVSRFGLQYVVCRTSSGERGAGKVCLEVRCLKPQKVVLSERNLKLYLVQ